MKDITDMIDLLSPLQEPFRLFKSFWVLCGIWVLYFLYQMCYYEWKFGKGAGEFFIHNGKKKLLKKYGDKN